MRTTIRRNKSLTYNEQMNLAREDAERSRTHPNGIANTNKQSMFSAQDRWVANTLKQENRLDRSLRRQTKKAKLSALGYTRTQRRSFGN
jgi:hypothetical protein